MNNVIRRTLAIVGMGLALASFGAAQSHGRGHNDGYGNRRANPPKALDHQFLDLFRGRGHQAQDRRNYEHQQQDRYNGGYGYGGYSGGYSGGYGTYGGHDGNRGYRGNGGYNDHGRGGHDNRRGH